MPDAKELLRSVCDDAGDGDYHTIYAPQNGFELYLGKRGAEFAFTIRCNESESFYADEHGEDVEDLYTLLISALCRVLNSRDGFDEDDEFDVAWVEATEDDDLEWTREKIDEWLGYELAQLLSD